MDAESAPRTPQDGSASVTAMPLAVQSCSLDTPPSGIIHEEVVDHPLSPVAENATEAIVCFILIDFRADIPMIFRCPSRTAFQLFEQL